MEFLSFLGYLILVVSISPYIISENEGARIKSFTFRFIDLHPLFATSVQITRKSGQPTLISVPCLNISEQPVTNSFNLALQNCHTVEIFSTADITVHGIVDWRLNRTQAQGTITAGFLALPHDQLGTEYMIDCYTPTHGIAQVAISAISNDTTINITCVSVCIFEGMYFSNFIVLQAGESGILTSLKSEIDMSGTYIRSDKPISVLVGAYGVYIPEPVIGAHGVIMEQLLPVSSWGKAHIAPPFQESPDGWIIRIMAINPGTNIWLQNCGNEESYSIILNSKSFEDIMVNGSAKEFLCVVTADQPIQVMQYVASSSDQKLGDPSMTIVPPLKDYHGNTTVRVNEKDDGFKDYADIIVSEQGKEFFHVNGFTLLDRPWSCVNVISPASEGSESATGYGAFCHYWIELQNGEYNLTNKGRSEKFWVRLYTLHNTLGAAMMADIAPEGMVSTTLSTSSTVTIKGGVLNTMTSNETPGSEHYFIIYIMIGISSGLLLLSVIIVVFVMRTRHERQQRSTASALQPNERDNYMPLNVRSGMGSGDVQEAETDAYQALNAPPQRSSRTHSRIETAQSMDDDRENPSLYHEYDDASSTRPPDGQQTKNQGGTDEDEKTASPGIGFYGNQQVIDLRQKREGGTNISTETGESNYIELI